MQPPVPPVHPSPGSHTSPSRRRATRILAAGSALALVPAVAFAGTPKNGSAGIGDVYYPNYGNGGYDVAHYTIDVDYRPSSDLLTGTTTITAKATQDLKRFNLDFVLDASAVTVNGTTAKFNQNTPHELVITPKKAVAKGKTMTIKVSYAGVPSSVSDGTIKPWIKTADGAAAVGEPEIAAWWYPSNDHPRDKATYDVSVAVPTGVEALSNGVLRSTRHTATRDIWRWQETKPMAPYLAFFVAGQFDVTSGTTASGLPWTNAVASNGGNEGTYAAADLKRTPEVIDFLSRQFGSYPFNAIGGVAPNADFGFALENQTRPVYTRSFWSRGANIGVVVHENAHQWYGDSVSVDQWKDIWLNEGFASYAEWLWSDSRGEGTVQQLFDEYDQAYPADDDMWLTHIGDPGRGNEFNGAVYDRGAMTLQALRNRIGDPAFWQTMRNWAAQHKYGNGTVSEFIALAEKSSGEDLQGFFDAWLYSSTKPAATAENGYPTGAALRSLTTTQRKSSQQQADNASRSEAGKPASAASVAKTRKAMDALHQKLITQR